MISFEEILEKVKTLKEPPKQVLNSQGTLEKARIYVESAAEAPKNFHLFRGPRGGIYYETTLRETPQEEFPDTKEDRQKLVDYSKEKRTMGMFLSGLRSEDEVSPKLEGRLNTQIEVVADFATEHLDRYSEFLDGKTFSLTNKVIRKQVQLLADTTTISAVDAFKLSKDSVDKIIYQEMRSWERQLGDHGVRHIEGDIRIFNEIAKTFNAAGGNISSRDTLLAYIALIHHDLGYTAEPSRLTLAGTKYHPEFSEKLFENEQVFFENLLGHDDYLKVKEFILKHDTADISWEKSPILTSISIADNLALFHREKLPRLFEKVRHSLSTLSKMQKALNKNNTPLFEKLKGNLFTEIDKTALPKYTKYLLKKAATEVSPYTPKVTLSMLAGEIGKLEYSKEAGLDIEIKHSLFEAELNKLYDQGQQKFVKLAQSFNITDFNKEKFDFIKNGEKILSVHRGFSKAKLEDYSQIIKHFTTKSFLKSKIYLKPSEKPPKGVRVQRGPRGGTYYEDRQVMPKRPLSGRSAAVKPTVEMSANLLDIPEITFFYSKYLSEKTAFGQLMACYDAWEWFKENKGDLSDEQQRTFNRMHTKLNGPVRKILITEINATEKKRQKISEDEPSELKLFTKKKTDSSKDILVKKDGENLPIAEYGFEVKWYASPGSRVRNKRKKFWYIRWNRKNLTKLFGIEITRQTEYSTGIATIADSSNLTRNVSTIEWAKELTDLAERLDITNLKFM